jgi:hypothetical protein
MSVMRNIATVAESTPHLGRITAHEFSLVLKNLSGLPDAHSAAPDVTPLSCVVRQTAMTRGQPVNTLTLDTKSRNAIALAGEASKNELGVIAFEFGPRRVRRRHATCDMLSLSKTADKQDDKPGGVRTAWVLRRSDHLQCYVKVSFTLTKQADRGIAASWALFPKRDIIPKVYANGSDPWADRKWIRHFQHSPNRSNCRCSEVSCASGLRLS